jgi:hypothetical protein
MSATRDLNPSAVPNEHLEIIAFMILGKMQNLVVDDKPMTGKEAIEWTKWSEDKFYRLVRLGKVKAFRPDPNGDPSYLKSQIIEMLKAS